jgi:hypothetical protein
MISKGLFSQIVMILLAVGIAFFYIEPTFADISQMQDEMSEYKQERKKVDAVNQLLTSLVDQLNSVPSADRQKLVTYIPDHVDTLSVPRTLQAIAGEAGVLFREVRYQELKDSYLSQAEEAGISDYPVPHMFGISFQGSYQQVKTMLSLMEQNEYPLEVHELEIAILEGGFLNVDATVITYSHELPSLSQFTE